MEVESWSSKLRSTSTRAFIRVKLSVSCNCISIILHTRENWSMNEHTNDVDLKAFFESCEWARTRRCWLCDANICCTPLSSFESHFFLYFLMVGWMDYYRDICIGWMANKVYFVSEILVTQTTQCVSDTHQQTQFSDARVGGIHSSSSQLSSRRWSRKKLILI